MPTKDELVQEAEAAGIEVTEKMTKAEIEEALKGNGQAEHAMAGQSEPYNPQQRRHESLA